MVASVFMWYFNVSIFLCASFKQNSTLKQSYENLEEEHYKTKEQLENVLRPGGVGANADQVQHFACKLCTKNFRSKELLEAHVKRKHHRKMDSPSEDEVEKGAVNSPEMRHKLHQKNVTGDGEAGGEDKSNVIEDGRDIPVIRCAECAKRNPSTAASIQCNVEDLLRSDQPETIADDKHEKEEATKPPDNVQDGK